ncbi:MAG TPA: YhdP family protein, partial [Azospira sp.]|nr:YhdP family protein [Azospira sp.]
LTFNGPDATGSAQGTYRLNGDGPGTIDLTAAVSKADGTAVWRYMPKVVSQDARDWLKTAITGGTASEAKLVLRGDLARFPFLDPKEGQFLVTARINNATLDYANGWPRIDDIQGSLRFEAARMLIEARSARLLGARLSAVKAEIADLDAPEELLKITGKAEGPTAEFLKFIDQSPVGDKIDNFTEDMRAQGEGRLSLDLNLPLRHLVDSRIKGEYEFANNQVVVEPGLPPMTQVNGRLHFTDGGISIKEVTGQFLGGPMRLSASNEGDKVLVNASGNLTAAALRRQLDLPLFDNLSGSAAWKGEVRVRKKNAELVVESDLKGLASSLPEPFNKSAATALPLRLERGAVPEVPGRKGAAPAVPREQVKFTLGKLVSAQLIRRREAAGPVTERGAIALGEPLVLPERGVSLTIAQPSVDADFWRKALAPGNGNGGASGGAAAEPSLPLSLAVLKTPLLDVGGRRLHDVTLKATPVGSNWQLDLAAREAAGLITWEGAGRGKVRARLKHLILPETSPRQEVMQKMGEAESQDELPGLDIVADSFTLGSRRFGRLELLARNEGRVWRLDKVNLSSPEGSINGSGLWRTDPQGAHRTDLDFKLEASDAGKYLDRLGFPGTLKRGSASLGGKLAWNGTPTGLDIPSLSGDVKLTAEKGQFAKVEPGIGKLIGLLSLQSLPRRITLDFRDVFSEGFAFDTVEGTFKVQNGLMRTSDLSIDGPAAKVAIKGDINLESETQNLKVRVQPALGSSLALGTAMVHPVVGVAALIAQKVLQNPVDKIFAFEYAVTGSWEDPKVDKLSGSAAPAEKSSNPSQP